MLLAFHKPYGVLSQFTLDGSPHRTLADFGLPPNVYPIGRLDADSEGLLLLSDEPEWNAKLLAPERHVEKIYHVQVEGSPRPKDLHPLTKGVLIENRLTLPARAWIPNPPPVFPPRVPPIRQRKSVPDTWIAVALREGRNRQVRRMTAAVGFPTLRLIRTQIGPLELGGLASGAWRILEETERAAMEGRPLCRPGSAKGRHGGRPSNQINPPKGNSPAGSG